MYASIPSNNSPAFQTERLWEQEEEMPDPITSARDALSTPGHDIHCQPQEMVPLLF